MSWRLLLGVAADLILSVVTLSTSIRLPAFFFGYPRACMRVLPSCVSFRWQTVFPSPNLSCWVSSSVARIGLISAWDWLLPACAANLEGVAEQAHRQGSGLSRFEEGDSGAPLCFGWLGVSYGDAAGGAPLPAFRVGRLWASFAAPQLGFGCRKGGFSGLSASGLRSFLARIRACGRIRQRDIPFRNKAYRTGLETSCHARAHELACRIAH